MNCWKCNKKVSELPIQIGFRALCPHCDVDLHTCKNCRYYAIGKPNDCLVPGTDLVRDKEVMNFCEEFKPRTMMQEEKAKDPKNAFKNLFRDP